MEHDPATLVRVSREGHEIGEFYLSFVELAIKNQTFTKSDLGWASGMSEWEPLFLTVKSLRSAVGKKTRITSGQRAYLKRCDQSPWVGMSNREAHAIIDKLHGDYEIPPGDWINEPATKAQADFLIGLGGQFFEYWTKGQASLAISTRLIELENAEADIPNDNQ
jgi:hypothetical protein